MIEEGLRKLHEGTGEISNGNVDMYQCFRDLLPPS